LTNWPERSATGREPCPRSLIRVGAILRADELALFDEHVPEFALADSLDRQMLARTHFFRLALESLIKETLHVRELELSDIERDEEIVAVQSVKPALRRLAFSDKAAAWMPLSNSDKLSATAAST
jgi:hypothetical protein